jgi:hypothetical protein
MNYFKKGNTQPSIMPWGTYDGRRLKIGKVEDMHLANIIQWVREGTRSFALDTLLELEREAEIRNLKSEFLKGAPYPHKNDDGEWIQFINGRPTVVGR